jgi:hypothetical protein
MERKKLESAAVDYANLRGLYGIPIGGLFILAALGNANWGPLRHAWVFVVAVLLLGAACLPINRYYNDHYGRITPSTRQELKMAVVTMLGAAVIAGGSIALRSRASWSLDLPVNPIAATFGLVMLVYHALVGGLKAHQTIVWGALLVAGLMPVWGGADPSNTALVLAGAATILAGVFGHRLLAQTFGSPIGPRLEDDDAGA